VSTRTVALFALATGAVVAAAIWWRRRRRSEKAEIDGRNAANRDRKLDEYGCANPALRHADTGLRR
jgi:membrane protein implicated in regulation of membrane protease activity